MGFFGKHLNVDTVRTSLISARLVSSNQRPNTEQLVFHSFVYLPISFLIKIAVK